MPVAVVKPGRDEHTCELDKQIVKDEGNDRTVSTLEETIR